MRDQIAKLTRDKEEALVLARILDVAEQAERRGWQAGDFLEPRIQQMVPLLIHGQFSLNLDWQGGFEGAERSRLVLYKGDNLPDNQVAILKISASNPLQHRDCLGSLLGLGLRREKLGDIIVQGTAAYVIVGAEIADFITSNLLKVGRQEVTVEPVDSGEKVIGIEPKIITATIASLRLDAVIAAGMGLSRGEAQRLVEAEKVKLNYQETTRTDRQIKEGDLISVRGHGRLKLVSLGGKTRKDRLKVTLEKY